MELGTPVEMTNDVNNDFQNVWSKWSQIVRDLECRELLGSIEDCFAVSIIQMYQFPELGRSHGGQLCNRIVICPAL